MPMSRCLKNDMRSAKSPKSGTTGGKGSKPESKQYHQNHTTPQKAKSYGVKGGDKGSAGKLII